MDRPQSISKPLFGLGLGLGLGFDPPPDGFELGRRPEGRRGDTFFGNFSRLIVIVSLAPPVRAIFCLNGLKPDFCATTVC